MADDIGIDDLFNFEAGIEHLLREPEEEERNNTQRPSGGAAGNDRAGNDDLGLDSEIKVTKKRAPPVKLDENRYAEWTSPRGWRIQLD